MDTQLLMGLNNFSMSIDMIGGSLLESSNESLTQLSELNRNVIDLQNSITENLMKVGLISEQIPSVVSLRNQIPSVEESNFTTEPTIDITLKDSAESLKSISDNLNLVEINPTNIQQDTTILPSFQNLNLPNFNNINIPVTFDITNKDLLQSQLFEPSTIPINYELPTEVPTNLNPIVVPVVYDQLTNFDTIETLPRLNIVEIESNRIFTNSLDLPKIESVKIPIEYENISPQINPITIPTTYEPISEFEIPRVDKLMIDWELSKLPNFELPNFEDLTRSFNIPLEFTKPTLPNFEFSKQTLEFDFNEPDFSKLKSYEISLNYEIPDINLDRIVVPLEFSKPINFDSIDLKPLDVPIDFKPLDVPIVFGKFPPIENISNKELQTSKTILDLNETNITNTKLSNSELITPKLENVSTITNESRMEFLTAPSIQFDELITNISDNLTKFNGKLNEVNSTNSEKTGSVNSIIVEPNFANFADGFMDVIRNMTEYLSNKFQTLNTSKLDESKIVDSGLNMDVNVEARPENILNTNVEFERISSINSEIGNKSMMSIDPDQFRSLISSMESNSKINVGEMGRKENITENVETKTISLNPAQNSFGSESSSSADLVDLLSSLDQKMSMMVNILAGMKVWFDDNQNMGNSGIRNYKHL